MEGKVVFKYGSWKILSSGMGNFLNPPGDAEHFYHVSHPRMLASLRAALESDIPEKVLQVVRKLLDENKPVITEEWVEQVYRYFKHCYSPDGLDQTASNHIIDRTDSQPPENHLGYLHIREWFPEYQLRRDLIR